MDTFGQSLQVMAGLLTNPTYWLVLVLAIVLTGPVGLIPGVGSTTLLAIALPFLILHVDPVIGMIFVAGMLSLGNTMDIIPAVLLGYPSGSTAVDFLEGHQLARRGLGARVLGASYSVSMIGGVIGAFTLALVMPLMRPFIVQFSYAEIAAMAMFGIVMVAVLSRGAPLRGLAAATLGLLLASIGTLPITGVQRFSMGHPYLWEGLPLVPFLLGLLALPEIVDLSTSKQAVAKDALVSNREVWIGFKEGLQRWRTIPRQSLFGVFMGAIPGIGGATIEWLSYALGIAFAKDRSQFGKGSLDGILFTESAQSAKEAGQAVPTLAFGIPGGSGWALCLAAMIGYGLAPGLGMLGQNLDITMGVVLTIGLGNLLGALLALLVTAQVARLTRVPYPYVAGLILPLMFVSAFQANFQFGDIVVLLAMGALGLAMKWFGWPRPPLLIAFVLGPILERNLWTSVGLNGVFGILNRPYAVAILVAATVTGIYLVWLMHRGERRLEEALEQEGVAVNPPPAAPPVGRQLSLELRWRWEYVFLAILAAWVGGVVLRDSLSLTGASRFLPLWASAVFLALGLAVCLSTFIRRQVPSEIMDIGMRSGTDHAALRAVLPILGWIGAFIVSMGLIGFQATAILFPLVFIPANLGFGRNTLARALAPAAISAFVVIGLLENTMHVIWPEPFLWNALTSQGV